MSLVNINKYSSSINHRAYRDGVSFVVNVTVVPFGTVAVKPATV